MPESSFKPELFEREDEAPDRAFYTTPRLLVHIDDSAISAASHLYGELVPHHAAVLDLMSSYRSHLPDSLALSRLCGLGMNAVEMQQNPQLTDYVVHDLNADPRLPFADDEFDAVVVTVSVQYMTRPLATFREIARILRPGGPFVVTYSNRMFPTKAVRIWRALSDGERAGLIAAYFKNAGGFGGVTAEDRTIISDSYNDPLFGVWAHRLAESEVDATGEPTRSRL